MPPTPWAIPAAMVRPTPDQVIVALDGMDLPRALAFSARLRGLRWVKVGPELFASSGEQAVLALGEKGYQVFLDLKFHDIPATMAGACRAAARSGARLLTLHAAAGGQALAAAVEGAAAGAAEAGLPMPTLLAVTVLTSWDPRRFAAELAIHEPLTEYVPRLAGLAARAGLGGCICSPHEVAALRAWHPLPFELVTPGVRPAGAAAGDQARVMTPQQALAAGASRLVIGRPISTAADPAAAFAAICS